MTNPPTGWLKTTETYSLTVLEARVGRATLPPKPPGEEPSFPLPAPGVAPRVPWLVAASLPSLPMSSHGHLPCESPGPNVPFLRRIPVILDYRASLLQYDLMLT